MRKILADLFSGSLILYLILFLLENVFPTFVSAVFSLNYLLIPVLIFGIASSIFPEPEKKEKKSSPKSLKSDIILSIVLSLVGGGLIYYKIDLEFPLRQIIASLSTILILIMSMLVILPQDFKMPKFKFKFRFLYLLLLIPLIIFGFSKIPQSPENETIVRLPSDQYKVILVNKSDKKEYSQTYKKLLENNGYTNITFDDGEGYAEATMTTIMYGEDDSPAGEEVTNIVQASIGEIQTAPIEEGYPQTIIIVLK